MVKKISYALRIAKSLLFCSVFLIKTDTNYKVMIGSSSVGNGIVTGVASVVTGFKQISNIRKGDIVVAHTTSGSWDSALQLSAGIVTESSCSHALLLGEQLGIPVIIGVVGATKKIIDGSLIILDCYQRTVCEAAKNHFFQWGTSAAIPSGYRSSYFTYPVHRHQPLHQGWQWMYDVGEDDQKSSFSIVDAAATIIKNSQDTHGRRYKGIDFNAKRLQRDKPVIKNYIINEVGRDIERSEAWYVNKQLACQIGGISEKVYHSRPLEFFKNRPEVEKVSDVELSDPEAIEYIWDGIVAFTQQGVAVTNETLGSFLFARLVDNMKIEEADKKVLKEDPVKMNDFVKNPGIIRDEYMKFNVRNLAIQYYLEKHCK